MRIGGRKRKGRQDPDAGNNKKINDLPPIPGLHRRSCQDCGAALTLTIEQSMESSVGSLIERHQTSCPHCRGTVIYTIPRGSQMSTTENVGAVSEAFRRIRALLGIRRSGT